MSNKYQSFFYLLPGSAFLIVLEGIRIFFYFFLFFACILLFFVVYLKQLIRTVTNKETNKMKAKRITKGYYQFQNGFVIYYDRSIEGQNKWVINNDDYNKIEKFISDGNDQLWATLTEAKFNLQYAEA